MIGENSNNTLDLIIQKNIWQPSQPLRLHLGCGENYLDGYINIDYPPKEHPVMNVNADIYQDITQLQFPSGSVDEIRLHHVFEHFDRVYALALLIKWHVWLKIGGRLIIETPDLIGSAKTLLSDAPWSRKMAVVRHLAGSHEASWAFHLDHWFPERFEHTLTRFGFGSIETKTFSWQNEPFLSNVIVVAVKKSNLSLNELITIAEDLLKESLVVQSEKPLFDVWCKKLRTMIQEEPISNIKQESYLGKVQEVSDIEEIQYEELQKMWENNFRDVSVLIKLAKFELVRANRKKAKNYLIAATTVDPNNKEAKTMLEKIETIR